MPSPAERWFLTFETAIVMVKDFQLAIDDVAQKLNIRKEELLAYMKEKEV